MRVSEYVQYDAVGLADLIRGLEVTPAEVQNAAAEAIDEAQNSLNALARPRFETALSYEGRGPFAGAPFLLKDLVAHANGVPQRAGSRLLGGGVTYPYDTELMSRFRKAGLATMGVTVTPEFGFSAGTEPVTTGPVLNPWDPTRSTGGSSGGSAAMVAAHAVPVAHANDGGGSIRIPAACCGLVGLKPSRGRTSVAPDYADPLMGLGVEFALTRTVRDCAALLDAVHGPAPGERYWLPSPRQRFSTSARQGLEGRRLRVALITQRFDGGPVDDECVAAVDAAARMMEQHGHRVETAAPEIDIEAFDDANFAIWCAFLADGAHSASKALGVGLSADTLEATTLACVEHGAALTAMDMFAADRVVNTVTRTMAAFQESYDILLTPTLAVPTWPIGHLNADDASLDARGWYDKIFDAAPFTALFNATGQPAISLPLAISERGWPIGVQAVARYADEATLLALAGDLEEEMPWSHQRPRLMVSSSDRPEQSIGRTLDLTAKPAPPSSEARPREDHAAAAAWKM